MPKRNIFLFSIYTAKNTLHSQTCENCEDENDLKLKNFN